MAPLKLKLIVNADWKSMPEKMAELKRWFSPAIDLQITSIQSVYKTVPFIRYPGPQKEPLGIDPIWYDKYVKPLGKDCDTFIFVLPMTIWPVTNSVRGWGGEGRLQVGCDEYESMYVGGVPVVRTFFEYVRHELAHDFYRRQGKTDNTHKWIYNGTPEKMLEDLATPLTKTQVLLKQVMDLLIKLNIKTDPILIQNLIEQHMEAPTPPQSKYKWDTPANARHSSRVIMDEMGLTGLVDKPTKLKAKDLLCACIQQESGFNPRAIGAKNSNGTTDYGLCQYNDGKNAQGQAYWIGKGADFKDIDEVLGDPEKNVRVMVREYKKGNLKYWSSYSTGAYRKWL